MKLELLLLSPRNLEGSCRVYHVLVSTLRADCFISTTHTWFMERVHNPTLKRGTPHDAHLLSLSRSLLRTYVRRNDITLRSLQQWWCWYSCNISIIVALVASDRTMRSATLSYITVCLFTPRHMKQQSWAEAHLCLTIRDALTDEGSWSASLPHCDILWARTVRIYDLGQAVRGCQPRDCGLMFSSFHDSRGVTYIVSLIITICETRQNEKLDTPGFHTASCMILECIIPLKE